MDTLVPLKVKIGLRANGHADHPDWQKLPLALTEDPAQHMVISWKYDNTSGHQEETPDSPRGMQWGMIMVTQQFATEALTTFPDLVTVMTEAEAESFWENKHTVDIPENKSNNEVLQALQTELSLKESLEQDTTELKAKIAKAINPDDTEPGVKKNPLKTWTDAKSNLGIEIKK